MVWQGTENRGNLQLHHGGRKSGKRALRNIRDGIVGERPAVSDVNRVHVKPDIQPKAIDNKDKTRESHEQSTTWLSGQGTGRGGSEDPRIHQALPDWHTYSAYRLRLTTELGNTVNAFDCA